eukprot:462789-Rhodomonas_salina.2
MPCCSLFTDDFSPPPSCPPCVRSLSRSSNCSGSKFREVLNNVTTQNHSALQLIQCIQILILRSDGYGPAPTAEASDSTKKDVQGEGMEDSAASMEDVSSELGSSAGGKKGSKRGGKQPKGEEDSSKLPAEGGEKTSMSMATLNLLLTALKDALSSRPRRSVASEQKEEQEAEKKDAGEKTRCPPEVEAAATEVVKEVASPSNTHSISRIRYAMSPSRRGNSSAIALRCRVLT